LPDNVFDTHDSNNVVFSIYTMRLFSVMQTWGGDAPVLRGAAAPQGAAAAGRHGGVRRHEEGGEGARGQLHRGTQEEARMSHSLCVASLKMLGLFVLDNLASFFIPPPVRYFGVAFLKY